VTTTWVTPGALAHRCDEPEVASWIVTEVYERQVEIKHLRTGETLCLNTRHFCERFTQVSRGDRFERIANNMEIL
jgi:hypothetical protein